MEELSRFDVAEYNGVLMVVVESELLPPDPAVVRVAKFWQARRSGSSIL